MVQWDWIFEYCEWLFAYSNDRTSLFYGVQNILESQTDHNSIFSEGISKWKSTGQAEWAKPQRKLALRKYYKN